MLTGKQAGTLDDTSIIDDAKVNAELFVGNKPKWYPAFEGAEQKKAMS